jgi:hypothetical protein
MFSTIDVIGATVVTTLTLFVSGAGWGFGSLFSQDETKHRQLNVIRRVRKYRIGILPYLMSRKR